VVFDVLVEPSCEISLGTGIRSRSITELNISVKTVDVVNVGSSEGEFELSEVVMGLVS